MRILITGGFGFLAQGMVPRMAAAGHTLRLMDVRSAETPHEAMVGDVANLADVRKAVEGMDGMVLAHMAPRTPNAYATPELCFDINVRGTANLFFAAAEAGIRRVVLISSTAATQGYEQVDHTLPGYRATGLYGLTKSCQELIGDFYAREEGFQVAALRVGYLVDGEAMQDKYGRKVGERNALDCDLRDVGDVARRCLEREVPGFEAFYVMSTHEAMDSWDLRHTCERLDWEPLYAFDRLPLPTPKPAADR